MQRSIPRGTIVWWNGTVDTIPTTWRLCDGTRFTPDLSAFFIIGAGDTYAVNQKGGTVNHLHDFTGNGHTHPTPSGIDLNFGAGWNPDLEATQVTGTTDAEPNLPPYFSKLLIMYDGRRF